MENNLINQVSPIVTSVSDKFANGASHVWAAMVKQVYINSSMQILISFAAFFLSYFLFYLSKHQCSIHGKDPDADLVCAVLGWLVIGVAAWMFLSGCAGIINPDYYVIGKLVDAIKH